MKRDYTISTFHKIVKYLKEEIPNVTIATDIICGFSCETDEDHNETIKVNFGGTVDVG